MRLHFPFAALFLAACGGGDAPGETPGGGARHDYIECRVGNMNDFEPVCSGESADTAEGRVLTLRFPSGGFRRVLIARDGRGVLSADGAEQAHVTIIAGNRIEIEIGGDRFRLPARVMP
jgi:hypothetical protein